MERQAAKILKTSARGSQLQTHPVRSSAAAHPMLELQRSIGNSATQRLIRSPYIQTKLQVSSPDDPLEQEADRTAETVMRMPEPCVSTRVHAKPRSTRITRLAQRETDEPDDEDEVVAANSHSYVPLAVREDDEEEKDVPVQRACADCEEEMLAQRLADELQDEEVINREDGRATNSRRNQNSAAARPAGAKAAARNIHPLNDSANQFPHLCPPLPWSTYFD